MANPGPATTVSSHPQGITTTQALRLLTVYKGVPVTAVGETVLPIINSTSYSVKDIVITNANNAGTSIDASATVFTLYTGTAGAGTGIKTTTTLTSNTSASVVNDLSPTTTAAQTAQNLYFRVTTASSNAGTVDVYVYGFDFS